MRVESFSLPKAKLIFLTMKQFRYKCVIIRMNFETVGLVYSWFDQSSTFVRIGRVSSKIADHALDLLLPEDPQVGLHPDR